MPTKLAQYGSTTDSATHVVPLSPAVTKNTLFVICQSAAMITPPAGAVVLASHVGAKDMRVYRIPATAGATSLTFTLSASANFMAIVIEDQWDGVTTPYCTLTANWPQSGTSTWTNATVSWSGQSEGFAFYAGSGTSGDLTAYDNSFADFGDTGVSPSSFGSGRLWAANKTTASFSGGVVATLTAGFFADAVDSTLTGALAYKTGSTTPTANAGPDQTVTSGATVTLDGSGSTPGTGTITTYTWSQVSGPAVTLSSTSVVNPTFTAPTGPATIVLGLTVTNSGAVTSSQDTVTITVSAPGPGPTPSVKDENANATGVTNRTAWFDLVGQAAMPGFVRKSYYNPGQTAQFSIDYNSAYTCEVYRLGYYGAGNTGARKVATFAGTPTNQPAATVIGSSNGALDCSNWSTNVSWAIPADACPGWYNLVLKGSNGTDDGQILFCVTDTTLTTKRRVVVLSAEATWMGAYSYYGGKTNVLGGPSLYGSNGPMTGGIENRAYCVSYDRPVVTAEGVQQTYFFNAEFPLLRTLERFGFDVAYATCEQVDADPTVLDGRDLVIISGHNEYISQTIKDKFDSLAAAGKNIMNLSGNDFFWRTRYGTTNFAATTTKGRVMWCRKDTMTGPGGHVAGTEIVPGDWGGTWQDTRWALREPTMDLFGDRFIANGIRDDNLAVPFAYKNLPLYRNCAGIQALTSGQTFNFGQGTLGMEWDKPETSLTMAPLSATTVDLTNNTSDVNGENYNLSSVTTHQMIMVRNPGGGYIFNASNVQFSWVLDGFHVRGGDVSSNEGRQMFLNVCADLGVLGDGTLVTSAGLTQPTPVSSVLTAYGLGSPTQKAVIFLPTASVSVHAIAPTVVAITPWVRLTLPTASLSVHAVAPTVKAVDPSKIPNAVFEASGATLEDLIEEVLSKLQGYTVKGDQVTYLASSITESDLTFTPDDAKELSRGTVEVDYELMRVQKVDRVSGSVTILPRGRGWRGTIPVPHDEGATVTMSPLVPRVSIAFAINDSVRGLYPDLFGVSSTEFTFNSMMVNAWLLPAEADRVLSVHYKDILGNWVKVHRWALQSKQNTTDFASGRSLRLTDVPVGRTVRVVYGTVPTVMTKTTSLFSSTGLGPEHRDLVVLGAMIRLIPALDVARLSVKTVAADELDQPIQLGSAGAIAKSLFDTYQRRLLQEQMVLQHRYPTPIHIV